MEALVKVENQQIVTDSRQIAEHFEKRHDNVLRDVEGLKADVLNFEEMFMKNVLPDKYGRKQKVYLMNRDGFMLLAMGFTGKKALEWKLKYIKAFNDMEQQLKAQVQDSYMIADPVERAKRWIEEETVRQEQAKQLEAQKPKVVFADAVSTSKSSVLVGELAKIIKQNGVDIGQRRLFQWLRDNGYLMKSGSSKNMPTQRAMEMKLFEIKEGSYINGAGVNVTTKTSKVTGKGQIYFVNKLLAIGG